MSIYCHLFPSISRWIFTLKKMTQMIIWPPLMLVMVCLLSLTRRNLLVRRKRRLISRRCQRHLTRLTRRPHRSLRRRIRRYPPNPPSDAPTEKGSSQSGSRTTVWNCWRSPELNQLATSTSSGIQGLLKTKVSTF